MVHAALRPLAARARSRRPRGEVLRAAEHCRHPPGSRSSSTTRSARRPPFQRRRVTVIVSDATRDEPRREFLRGTLRRGSRVKSLTIAIATGTHGPASADFVAELARACRAHRDRQPRRSSRRRPRLARHDRARDAGPRASLRRRRRSRHRDGLHSPALLRGIRRRGEGDLPGLGQAAAIRKQPR